MNVSWNDEDNIPYTCIIGFEPTQGLVLSLISRPCPHALT